MRTYLSKFEKTWVIASLVAAVVMPVVGWPG